MSWYYSPESVKSAVMAKEGLMINTANSTAVMLERVPFNDRVIFDSETFDIFLSYRSVDGEYAFGIYLDLVRRGFRVYLDRIADAGLNREKVTRETANVLRKRLMQSKSLFYIVSEKSGESKWMPWELAFQDGYRAKSAVVPVSNKHRGQFQGMEYVELYPKVIAVSDSYLWIDTADEKGGLTDFKDWRDSVPDRKCGMPKCPLPK